MNILVIGGAGYIGSHFSYLAHEAGHNVCVFDDFSSGHEWAVRPFPVIRGSLSDYDLVVGSLANVDVVCHFAAKIVVSESVAKPDMYFSNNLDGTRAVLAAMTEAGCDRLVFSSTAAVYGLPSDNSPICEDHQLKPINPYGESKLLAERCVNTWARLPRRSATIFRYFNAAGAMPQHNVGECHIPETHLIPNVLNAILNPAKHSFTLYGDDYGTEDGTCIRDYVHVKDIALAHLLALDAARFGCEIFNLGYGRGFSNLEVIRACEKACGEELVYNVSSRRSGDPPVLITDARKVSVELGWEAKHSGLDEIISDALLWHRDVMPIIAK